MLWGTSAYLCHSYFPSLSTAPPPVAIVMVIENLFIAAGGTRLPHSVHWSASNVLIGFYKKDSAACRLGIWRFSPFVLVGAGFYYPSFTASRKGCSAGCFLGDSDRSHCATGQSA
jgi:hypothetical protein